MSATGRTNKQTGGSTPRIAQDKYNTPQQTVEELMKYVDLGTVHTFLEPCKGTGIIYDSIPEVWQHPRLPSISHPIIKSYCELSEGSDYLTTEFSKRRHSDPLRRNPFDLIVTNPPFSLAQQFLEKSLSEAVTVCYLLRINFLGSQMRKEWWEKITPPNKLLVCSQRPKFINNKTDATEYAWFCWDQFGIIKKPSGIHII